MKEVTWNFSEAGHGKSSADGVGGSVKKLPTRESPMEQIFAVLSPF